MTAVRNRVRVVVCALVLLPMLGGCPWIPKRRIVVRSSDVLPPQPVPVAKGDVLNFTFPTALPAIVHSGIVGSESAAARTSLELITVTPGVSLQPGTYTILVFDATTYAAIVWTSAEVGIAGTGPIAVAAPPALPGEDLAAIIGPAIPVVRDTDFKLHVTIPSSLDPGTYLVAIVDPDADKVIAGTEITIENGFP